MHTNDMSVRLMLHDNMTVFFPCLRSRCPAMSLSDRCSGSELVCLCVRAFVCVCVCVSVRLRVSLGIYGGGWVGMFYHCCF